MSTITITDTHSVASTAGAPAKRPTPGRGLTFGGILRSEWIKLLSLRSIRWSVAVMLLLSWGGAALIAWATAGSEFATADSIPTMLVQSATFGSAFTVLVVGVLGALSMTSEYSSGLILSSLSAVPRRTPMFAAKAVVVALLALAVGALSTIGGGIIAAIFYGEGAFAALVEPGVLASFAGSTLYLMLAALISLGIGALLRSGAGAISVIVVLLFVSTLVFQVLMITGWAWVGDFAQWMPADLGYQLSTVAMLPADLPAEAAGVGYWPALGGLVAWAAAALVPAAILLKTRDAV